MTSIILLSIETVVPSVTHQASASLTGELLHVWNVHVLLVEGVASSGLRVRGHEMVYR